MAGQRPLEVITPPNMLRVKVGGRLGGLNAAVERAEAALRSMAHEFDNWIKSEIAGLEAAHETARREGLSADARATLYRCAHDLKGMGGTYGYPIVSRLGGLLSLLLENESATEAEVMPLIDAHVAAIRAAVRDEIRDGDHPVGQALITELERRVKEIGAA